MKDKLIDLAARWNTVSCNGMKPHDCADELLAILDAEGDGGAVGEVDKYERVNVADLEHAGARIVGFRIREGDQARGKYGLSEPLVWLHNVTHPHPARSGVVSDEDVRDAARYRWLRSREGISYLQISESAIDAAIQGERYE